MTREGIIHHLTKEAALTQREAEDVHDALMALIRCELLAERPFELQGVGTIVPITDPQRFVYCTNIVGIRFDVDPDLEERF